MQLNITVLTLAILYSGKVIVSEYKGMSDNEIHNIRQTQISQMAEKKQREAVWKHAELEYAQYEAQVIKMQDLLDQKKKEIEAEQRKMQGNFNDLLREQARL
jgi:RIB43A